MKIDLTKLEYKKLTIDSIPDLLDIQEEAFIYANGNTEFLRKNTVETFSLCFEEPSLVLGIYYEGIMIAFGILHVAKETKENLAYDIEEVQDVKENANVKLTIVRPDYRGNGLQRILINKLVEHAYEHGFTWASSTASPVNTWSCNNLRACGFKEVKVLEKYGGLKRILFTKKIR